MQNMTPELAEEYARRYYLKMAFAGHMEGYNNDELVEYGAWLAMQFYTGARTYERDLEPLLDEFDY